MKEDRMVFKILEDGTIRTTVDGISGANHASADSFVRGVDSLLAGKLHIERRGDISHNHAHAHEHHHDKEEA